MYRHISRHNHQHNHQHDHLFGRIMSNKVDRFYSKFDHIGSDDEEEIPYAMKPVSISSEPLERRVMLGLCDPRVVIAMNKLRTEIQQMNPPVMEPVEFTTPVCARFNEFFDSVCNTVENSYITKQEKADPATQMLIAREICNEITKFMGWNMTDTCMRLSILFAYLVKKRLNILLPGDTLEKEMKENASIKSAEIFAVLMSNDHVAVEFERISEIAKNTKAISPTEIEKFINTIRAEFGDWSDERIKAAAGTLLSFLIGSSE